jgi:acyl-CoA thioester hydrolase
MFSLDFKVRDYECDMQGIVNNAVYQNYLEHTRHEFLLSRGLDFAEITRAGLNLVVIRAEIDYLSSLRSGDSFRVQLETEKPGAVRVAFLQNIFRRESDESETLCIRARITAAATNPSGRPTRIPANIVEKLQT